MTHLSIRTLRTMSLTAAAALAATLSVPAAASTNQATSTAQPPASAGDEANADRHGNQRRICVRADFTGSRLLRTVCKTEAQWEAEGGVPGRE